MATISMRTRLQKIGEPKPGKKIPAFPSGFHSAPQSLLAALHAMLSPRIGEWTLAHESVFENLPWTEECQGLTTDGQNWFVSSNDQLYKTIHKYSFDFKHALGRVELPSSSPEDHIGDPDHFNGTIFVPVYTSPAARPPRVWEIDTGLNTLRITELGEDVDPGLGWCAINPWNGYLYTSPGDGVDRVHAYDPADSFAYQGSLVLDPPAVYGLQGGCFSTNGHLYVTSDRFASAKGTKQIRAYSAINGAFLGACSVPYDESLPAAEELEGLAICHLTHSGVPTFVHVVILDNDSHFQNLDDVYLRHLTVPDPAVL